MRIYPGLGMIARPPQPTPVPPYELQHSHIITLMKKNADRAPALNMLVYPLPWENQQYLYISAFVDSECNVFFEIFIYLKKIRRFLI
jgi:hypothetical protein